MIVNPDRFPAIKLAAQHIRQFQARYQVVGTVVCPKSPLPWYFIGLIHHMESGQSFDRHLYNGDPLTARTVHFPPGRPLKGTPPFTWDYSAQCSLLDEGYGTPKIWEIDDVLSMLESYNGRGYWQHDIYSPYLWSGTNHYTKGKFDEVWDTVDKHYKSVFIPNEVSNQLGCAGILKDLLL